MVTTQRINQPNKITRQYPINTSLIA